MLMMCESLLPLMCTSYMIQFLDKQTLAQASIMGFIQDLVRFPSPATDKK